MVLLGFSGSCFLCFGTWWHIATYVRARPIRGPATSIPGIAQRILIVHVAKHPPVEEEEKFSSSTIVVQEPFWLLQAERLISVIFHTFLFCLDLVNKSSGKKKKHAQSIISDIVLLTPLVRAIYWYGAIEVSHTACKGEFRRSPRSHS